MKLVNYAMNQFDPEFYTLPEEGFEVRMLMNNYRIMLGDDMYSRFMSPELNKANILLFTHIASSRDFLKTRDAILAHVQENFSKDLKWDVTGLGMVISASSHLLTKGQVKSLSSGPGVQHYVHALSLEQGWPHCHRPQSFSHCRCLRGHGMAWYRTFNGYQSYS